MELFFDTETSGFINNAFSREADEQAWAMQLAMILSTEEVIYGSYHAYIKSDGRTCHPGAREVHGISDKVVDEGITSSDVWKAFEGFWLHSDTFVCHNFGFDIEFIANLSYRGGPADQETEDSLREHPTYCTMRKTTDLLKIPFKSKAGFKFPKLEELYEFLFPGEPIQGAHNAIADVRATRRIYYELMRRNIT